MRFVIYSRFKVWDYAATRESAEWAIFSRGKTGEPYFIEERFK